MPTKPKNNKEVIQIKTREMIEKILGEKTLKKMGVGSLKGLTLYFPKTYPFDWNKIQELKKRRKELKLEFCSIDLIGILN